MDDGIGMKNTQLLWIHWSNHVISFHEEAGYERLEFSTYEEKMEFWKDFQRLSHPMMVIFDGISIHLSAFRIS